MIIFMRQGSIEIRGVFEWTVALLLNYSKYYSI